METPFDFSVMEELLKKASLDETGELSVLINNLIMAGRKAGRKYSSISIIKNKTKSIFKLN